MSSYFPLELSIRVKDNRGTIFSKNLSTQIIYISFNFCRFKHAPGSLILLPHNYITISSRQATCTIFSGSHIVITVSTAMTRTEPSAENVAAVIDFLLYEPEVWHVRPEFLSVWSLCWTKEQNLPVIPIYSSRANWWFSWWQRTAWSISTVGIKSPFSRH